MAKIANVALSDTFNTWRVRSNFAFDRLSQFAVDNNNLYANTVYANNNLFALKNATVTKNLTVSGNTVTNKLTVTSLLTVSGNTTLGNSVDDVVSTVGSVTVGKNLTVTGNTTTLGLSVTGSSTLGNSVDDVTAISGSATITKNLVVSGNATFNKLVTTSQFTINGNTALGNGVDDVHAVTGTMSVSKNLSVAGNATFNKITVTSRLAGLGNTALGDSVNDVHTVTGSATISKNLVVSGNVSGVNLSGTNTGDVAYTGDVSSSGSVLTIGAGKVTKTMQANNARQYPIAFAAGQGWDHLGENLEWNRIYGMLQIDTDVEIEDQVGYMETLATGRVANWQIEKSTSAAPTWTEIFSVRPHSNVSNKTLHKGTVHANSSTLLAGTRLRLKMKQCGSTANGQLLTYTLKTHLI